jgi:hypothetical protein
MPTYIPNPAGPTPVEIRASAPVPDWIQGLLPGQVMDVPMLNVARSDFPAGWGDPGTGGGGNGTMSGSWTNWNQKAIEAPDFDDDPDFPGLIFVSAGHLDSYGPVKTASVKTLMWDTRNIPNQHWPDQNAATTPGFTDDYEYPDDPATYTPVALGTQCGAPHNEHTYGRMFVFPKAFGGGSKGTLIYYHGQPYFSSTGRLMPCVHGYDLSQRFMGFSRITPSHTTLDFDGQGQLNRQASGYAFPLYGCAVWDPIRAVAWYFGGPVAGAAINASVAFNPLTGAQTRFIDGSYSTVVAITACHVRSRDIFVMLTYDEFNGLVKLYIKQAAGRTLAQLAGVQWQQVQFQGVNPYAPVPWQIPTTSISGGDTLNTPNTGNMFTGGQMASTVSGTTYYAIVLSGTSYKLASSQSNALANIPLSPLIGQALTDAQGGFRRSVSTTWPVDVGMTASRQQDGAIYIYDAATYESEIFPYDPRRVFKLAAPTVGREALDPWVFSNRDFSLRAGTPSIRTKGFLNGVNRSFIEFKGLTSDPAHPVFVTAPDWDGKLQAWMM